MDHNTKYQNGKTAMEMLEEAFPVGSPFPPHCWALQIKP